MALQTKKTGRSALAHIIFMVGGTTASQALTALAAPILTRLYSPRDFGVYAIALAVYNLTAAIVCLKYDSAIVLPRSERSAVNVFALCLIVALAMSTLSGAVLFAGWALGAGSSSEEMALWAVWMIPVGVLTFGIQQAFRLWFVRKRGFPTITTMILTQAFVTLGVQLGAGALVSSDPAFLMLGTVLGTLAMIVVAAPQLVRTVPRALLSAIRWSRIVGAARRHRKFPLYSSPYYFVGQAATRLVLLILAMFVPTAVIGEFALAQRVVTLPTAILAASMTQVFYSRAAHQLEDVRLQRLVYRVMVAGALIIVPLVAANFICADELFPFVFGREWFEAGRFAAYLGMSSGILTLTIWLDRVYDIRGRQQLSLVQEAVADTISLTAMALTMYFTRNGVTGIASYVFCVVAYYITWTYVTFRVARFPIELYRNLMATIAAASLFALAAGALAELVVASHLLQAVVFLCLNAPLIALGVRIGRNGLNHRPTTIASIVV